MGGRLLAAVLVLKPHQALYGCQAAQLNDPRILSQDEMGRSSAAQMTVVSDATAPQTMSSPAWQTPKAHVSVPDCLLSHRWRLRHAALVADCPITGG
ncbi:hypothetical protein WJX73_001723 [Symbiochloris irregularis]|uniref:Secreted protein n=1 Tax=Symbiochloris irregularis TaxID=706552 RepID=A0AAW1PW09_9CHLO